MSNCRDRIRFLDSLRAIAIVMVIGQHALGYNQIQTEIRGTIGYWFQIAVPIFFLVDGYLFLYRLERTGKLDYADYMRRSAMRLVVPWTIFSLLYLMMRLGYEYFGHPSEQIALDRDAADLLTAMWVGAPAGQMYFLLSLFWLRSLSFATKYVRELSPLLILSAVCASNVLWNSMNGMVVAGFHIKANWGGGQDPLMHAVWGLQYYLLGCVLYVSNSWLSKHAMILAATALAIFASIYYRQINSPLLAHYSYLCGLYLLFLAIGARSRILWGIGSSTMGIYLLHFPGILKATSFAISLVFDNTRLSYYLLVVLGTLLCSLWISRLLMKVPHAYYIFGESR